MMTIGDNRFAALGINPNDLFMLYPHNRGFLTGERLTPDFRPARGVVFASLFVALSTLIIAFFLIFLVLPAIVARVGMLTEGTVVRYYSSTDSKGFPITRVDYTFEANNATYRLDQEVDNILFNQAYTGVVGIKVKYLPFMLDQATILDASLNNSVSSSADTLWTISAFELIILAVFAGSFYYTFRLWQLRRRRIAAWTTASLVVGHVVKCTGVVVTTKNSSSYQVTLTYRYQSPLSNEMVTGEDSNTRNDLRNTTLPHIGTPVVVVAYNKTIPPANPFRKTGSQGFVL